MEKYTIQTNKSGTRHIEVTDADLETIRKHSLLEGLTDSNGIVDEDTLEKLRLHTRSLITSSADSSKELLDLCSAVIFHDNMKAPGLKNLILLYAEWTAAHPLQEQEENQEQS